MVSDMTPDFDGELLEFESQGDILLSTSGLNSNLIRLDFDREHWIDLNAKELRQVAAECIRAAEHLEIYDTPAE